MPTYKNIYLYYYILLKRKRRSTKLQLLQHIYARKFITLQKHILSQKDTIHEFLKGRQSETITSTKKRQKGS